MKRYLIELENGNIMNKLFQEDDFIPLVGMTMFLSLLLDDGGICTTDSKIVKVSLLDGEGK